MMLRIENILAYLNGEVILNRASFCAYVNELTIIHANEIEEKILLETLTLKDRHECEYTFNDISITSFEEKDYDNFRKRNIGVVFQQSQLIHDLKIKDHFSLYKKMYSISNILETDPFQVKELQSKYPSELNKEEYIRVCLTLLFMQQSAIMVLGHIEIAEKYREVLYQLIDIYKEKHIIIMFSSDKKSENNYIIENQKLIQYCSQKPHIKLCEETLLKHFSMYSYYFKMKLHHKLVQTVLLLGLSISIGFMIFSKECSNIKIENKNLFNQITMYKATDQKNIFNQIEYQSITSEEINKVKEISSVQDIWPIYIGYRDYSIQENEEDEYIIYKDNQKLVSKDLKDIEYQKVWNCSYNENKDYASTDDIVMNFNVKDGVYLNQSIVNCFGLKNNELNGCEIEFPLYIPAYRTINGEQMIKPDESTVFYDGKICFRKIVKIKVSGISNQLGVSVSRDGLEAYKIFYPQSLLEKYQNEIKDFQTQKINTEFQTVAYQPSIYLVEPIETKRVLRVSSQIEDMGIYCQVDKAIKEKTINGTLHYQENLNISVMVLVGVMLLCIYIMKYSKNDLSTVSFFFRDRGYSEHSADQFVFQQWIMDGFLTVLLTIGSYVLIRWNANIVLSLDWVTWIFMIAIIMVMKFIMPYILDTDS